MVGPWPHRAFTFRALFKTYGQMWLRCDVCRGYAPLRLGGLHDVDFGVQLFRYAEGRTPLWDSTADARANGVTLARIHRAANCFADRNGGRYRLDLDHLIHRPLSALLGLRSLDAGAKEGFTELASRLSAAVAARGDLTWTRCHGDCHGFNARITENGPHAGQAMFFDFDDGGPGYLAYDLAVFLWARLVPATGACDGA
jgi:Ser/Thr protein kinase RdoA (MazF antagonist)